MVKGKIQVDENVKSSFLVHNWNGHVYSKEISIVNIYSHKQLPFDLKDIYNLGDLDGDIEVMKNAEVNIYITGVWATPLGYVLNDQDGWHIETSR